MRIFKRFSKILGVFTFFFFTLNGLAYAIPVSGGAGTPTFTEHQIIDGIVHIEGGVSYDPKAGPWIKQLHYLPPDPTGGPSPSGPFGGPVTLIEDIFIEGQKAWTDWHEDILTPGWVWSERFIFDILDQNNQSILSGFTWEHMGNALWFFFDKVGPGNRLHIEKQLICIDTLLCNPQGSTNGIYPIQIAEYPTVAEPYALPLLGLALMAIGFYRRRVMIS